MIVTAALLVVVALVLFLWGVVTGATALYWACVVVSAVAAVLLILARRRLNRPSTPAEPAGEWREEPAARRVEPEEHPPALRERTPDRLEPPTLEHELPMAAAPVADGGIPPSRHASRDDEPPAVVAAASAADPPAEEVEVTDLLLVVDLTDEVLVIDEHPRYHLAGCPRLAGHEPIPLPLDEARTDGFTPCGVCAPDRTLAERERGRRATS